MWSAMPRERLAQCLRDAAASPAADAAVEYPAWYLQRWHSLPEGYLSRRSAVLYERLIPGLYNQGRTRGVLAASLRALARGGPARILELGCGPGSALELASEWPGVSWRVAGVDLSPFMLEMARDRPAVTRAGVELRHAGVEALPWPDETFDALLVVHLFGHVPQGVAAGASAEARRVLRPQGRLVTVDHRWHRTMPGPGFSEERRQALNGGVLLLREFSATSGG